MAMQLIILGNGFDVHCGLKSKYEDFFRATILDTIGERFGRIQMKIGNAGFWEKLLLEYRKVNSEIDYKWCVVETIIKDTLWYIYFGEKNSAINVFHGIWKTALDCSGLGYNVETEAKRINEPIKKFLFIYCVSFFDYIAAKGIVCSEQEKLHLLIEHLLQELHNFESRFCKYLKDNIVNPDNEKEINDEYLINAVNLLFKISDFSNIQFKNIESIIHKEEKQFEEIISPYHKLTKWKDVNVLSKKFSKLKNTHILSFNYTAIFDILEVDSPCLYSNVHGKLCNANCKENCNSSNIIFGIDDNLIQAQSENTDLRVFSKTYRKMFDTSAPKSVLPQNYDLPIVIKFYGHSLSKADYSYFQSIFDYYNLYDNSKVSLVFYYSKGHEQTDAIYQLINEYGKTLSNKDQGKNMMHKLLLENRLKIAELRE